MFDSRYKNASNMHDSRIKRIDSLAMLRQRRRIVANDERRAYVERCAVASASPLLRYLMCLRCCSDTQREILASLIHDELPSTLSKVAIDELYATGLIPIVVQCLTAGDVNDLLRRCACQLIAQIIAYDTIDHMNELKRCNYEVQIVASIDTDNDEHHECICGIISTIIHKENAIFPSFRLELLVRLVNAFVRTSKTKMADLIIDIVRVMIERSEFVDEWSAAILPQIYNLIVLPTQTHQILEVILRFLSSLTEGKCFRDRIDKVIQYRFVPMLIVLISWPLTIQLAALKVIKNISKGYDEHIFELLKANLLEPLKQILQNSSAKIVRHLTLDILSQISGGHRTDVVAILDSGFMPIVLDVMVNGDRRSQLFAAWIVNNITNRGGIEEIKFIIDCGVLEALCKMLPIPNNDIIINTLGAFSQIMISLRLHAIFRDVVNIIEELDGLRNIENLQQHENPDICLLAFEINESLFFHENYFDPMTDEITELRPAANEFQFTFETEDWDSPTVPILQF